jgi:crotonobetainyl-CoA:carnitine CoA-transferase CaiB-like acyl-CoA transferase
MSTRAPLAGIRVIDVSSTLMAPYCAFRGFSAGGPYEDRPAYDDVIQAVSGMAAVQGGQGSAEYVRNAAADKTVGLMGAAAVLAALHGREKTGEGQVVEVPMLETMASFILLEQQGGRVFDPPTGPTGYARTESPNRRPCRTKDGHLAVMVYTDAQWRAFFEAIGRPELSDEPKYRTIHERTFHIDELYALVNAELETRTTAEWQAELDARQVPAARVNTLDDLFEDPHLAATGFFERVEHPTEGALRLTRTPVDFGGCDRLLPAPYLGADTFDVLRELGLDTQDIAHLADHGVLAGPEPAPAVPAV